jgi:hypothetical protein
MDRRWRKADQVEAIELASNFILKSSLRRLDYLQYLFSARWFESVAPAKVQGDQLA